MLKKLIDIQNELKAPKNLHNSFGNYNYRNCESILEAAKPICKKYGCLLTLRDEIEEHGNRIYVKASASISDGTDTETVTALARESETKKGMDDSQITGTASSYARKYALNGLFCIDDTKDADTNEYHATTNKASKSETPKKAPTRVNENGANYLRNLASDTGTDIEQVKKAYGVSELTELSIEKYNEVCAILEERKKKIIAEESK